ncbi:MAG: VOC family protein [Solirubrobacterales bacterium]
MDVELFAGIRVRDYPAALAWYTRLLGEPSFFPHDAEAVWTLGEGRSIYVVGDERGDGGAVATVLCGDLDAQLATIAARGLEPDDNETYSNGVRKAIYRDPEGNEVGFGGAPA